MEKDPDETGLGVLDERAGFVPECQEADGRLQYQQWAGSARFCISLLSET